MDASNNKFFGNQVICISGFPSLYISNTITNDYSIYSGDYNSFYSDGNENSIHLKFKNFEKKMTLKKWQTLNKTDLNSKELDDYKHSKFKFLYNASEETKRINLDDIWMDLNGNIYENFIVMEPYTVKIVSGQKN